MSTSEASILDAVVGTRPPSAPAVARPAAASTPASLTTGASPIVVAREAAVIAAVVGILIAMFARRDLGTGFAPHAAWTIVILLAARHGGRGFGFGLFAGAGALGLTALALGIGLVPLLTAVSNSIPDLLALLVSMLVACIASARERRIGNLAIREAELAKQTQHDTATISVLRDAAVALRARADRLDHCLTFLREVAARLEGDDPEQGAQAALDLALGRTGASAGVVVLPEGERLRTLAALGSWTTPSGAPADPDHDRTIEAALVNAAPVRAVDLPDARPEDAEVATPIVDDHGQVVGVMALRGVPEDSLRYALVHDLDLIARWCAKPIGHLPASEDREQVTPEELSAGDSRSQSVN